MKLDEKYYIVLNHEKGCKSLLLVDGKRISKNYAVTKNHINNMYTITHIKSGLAVSQRYDKLSKLLKEKDHILEFAKNYIMSIDGEIRKDFLILFEELKNKC